MLYEFNCIYVHPYVHSITCILACTHLHPPSGADEVSGQSWQLVTVMMKVMVRYFVSNTHKVMTALILVVVLGFFAGTD
jgi:hypothetical protein